MARRRLRATVIPARLRKQLLRFTLSAAAALYSLPALLQPSSFGLRACVCVYVCDLSTRLPLMRSLDFKARLPLTSARCGHQDEETRPINSLLASFQPLRPRGQFRSSQIQSPQGAKSALINSPNKHPQLRCLHTRYKHFTTSRGQRSVPEERDGDALTPH